LGHSFGASKIVEEPDALECEPGKRQIFVMKKGEKPVQLDHCTGEVDFPGALQSEFLNKIIVPLLDN
jgi:hypothetical protein